jgi:curved DNA-binding protein CbpA
MDPLDQNFYDILEVPRDASLQHIERAYRIARSTYQPASMATYSVFSDEENSELLRRVEEAYSVLSDARLRREYDARLRRESAPAEPPRPRPRPVAPSPPVRRPAEREWAAGTMSIELDESDEPSDGIYDGPALRRVRINRGIELEEIATITKISEAYLSFIEANRYTDLPAPVYVRGFLREVARCLKLDPKRVVDTYMASFDGPASA